MTAVMTADRWPEVEAKAVEVGEAVLAGPHRGVVSNPAYFARMLAETFSTDPDELLAILDVLASSVPAAFEAVAAVRRRKGSE